jgi:hypothetical protein
MPMSTQAPATRMSLIYITSGAVILVWTVVWLIYLLNNPPSSNVTYYLVFGFMATGGVVLAIGLRLGKIGRAAKQAENPPVVQQPAPTDPQQVILTTPAGVAAPPPPAVSAMPSAAVPPPTNNVVYTQHPGRAQYTS